MGKTVLYTGYEANEGIINRLLDSFRSTKNTERGSSYNQTTPGHYTTGKEKKKGGFKREKTVKPEKKIREKKKKKKKEKEKTKLLEEKNIIKKFFSL